MSNAADGVDTGHVHSGRIVSKLRTIETKPMLDFVEGYRIAWMGVTLA